MKLKFIVGLILSFMIILALSACSSDKESSNADDNKKQAEALEVEDKEKTSDISGAEENNTEQEQQNNSQQEEVVAEDGVMIRIFKGNDDATAFISEDVPIDNLSPEAVLEALVSSGAFTADIEVLSFSISTIEDVESIDLDLNDSFASYVSSMGTEGEYYTIGAICNTFLNAYGCEQIKITVDGNVLSTGHAEYPGYLNNFE